jgi:hypothetical protein
MMTTFNTLPAGEILFPTTPYFTNEEFFGREQDVKRIRQWLDLGHSLMLTGKRRIGRTWLLQHLCSALTPPQYLAIYDDNLQPNTIFPRSLRILLSIWINALHKVLRHQLSGQTALTMLDIANPPENIGAAFRNDLNILHQHLVAANHIAVIMLDEAEALLEYENQAIISAIIRSITTSYSHIRIIFAGYQLRSQDFVQSKIFDDCKEYQLYGVGTEGAENLLARRLECHGIQFESPKIWENILATTGEEPLFLRFLGQQLTEQARQQNDRIISQEQLDTAVENLFTIPDITTSILGYSWNTLGQNQLIHTLITALAHRHRQVTDLAQQDELIATICKSVYGGQQQSPEKIYTDLQRLCDLGFLRRSDDGMYLFSSGLLHEWIRRQRPNPAL